jgi:hypothetical protein
MEPANAVFLERVVNAGSFADLRDLADSVMTIPDASERRRLHQLGSQANPLFIPRTEPAMPVNAVQLNYFISQARMAAVVGTSERIVVSAPMKSGSTFISEMLGKALDLPKASLIMMLARPYDYPAMGAANRAHEVDELALLSACLLPRGFVAHHHMICSPYLARQIATYNLKFVLMKRNIFDCIVSLDEFCRKRAGDARAVDGLTYLQRGLPGNWAGLGDEERIHQLLDRFLSAYVHYHVSWRFLERENWVEPHWISYEEELLGDKVAMAGRLGDWLGRSTAEIAAMNASFARKDNLAELNFNRGVAGRGEAIQGANRRRVIDAFNDFKDLADCSDILG